MKTYGNVIVGIAAGVVASCACAATSWTDYFGGTPPTSGKISITAGDWAVNNKNQGDFKGTYVVSGGTLNLDGTYYKVFGRVDTVNNGNVLYATNGTTLAFSGASAVLARVVRARAAAQSSTTRHRKGQINETVRIAP